MREKGNPKSLRNFYWLTRIEAESNVAFLVAQAMERLMEQEQFSIGWEELQVRWTSSCLLHVIVWKRSRSIRFCTPYK